MPSEVVIVIPVYKDTLSCDERNSLKQCLRVLYRYPIHLVCPEGIDISTYSEVFAEYEKDCVFNYFDCTFFEGIDGYNRLLLNESFYKTFGSYEYMLIYQLDAYVFRDELDYWCERNYDFIGAPLIKGDGNSLSDLSVGNGGFSMRNIQFCLHYFSSKKNVFTARQLWYRLSVTKKLYTRFPLWILECFGFRNKPKIVASRYKHNEDIFWSQLLTNSNYPPKLPLAEESLHFAFERCPSLMYSISGRLPFGCHAWAKYEYVDFWKQYIN